jgi:hypothetical protein
MPKPPTISGPDTADPFAIDVSDRTMAVLTPATSASSVVTIR